MDIPLRTTRKYTDEEKRQLIANLDIEVAHRTRQFEAWLLDRLENFTLHQEGQVSRIPKQVRTMTMREFGEKYQGNVQEALRGFQKERLAAAGADVNFGDIDKAMRKRKYEVNHESNAAAGPSHQPTEESSRATKTAAQTSAARIATSSPKKLAGPSTGMTPRPRVPSSQRTPGASRIMGRAAPSPSPQKPKPPFSTSSYNHRPSTARPASPLKPQSSKPPSRVPSSSHFNPTLPPKTPSYPAKKPAEPQALRLPRRDENMLSENGSPLANPYEFGIGWFKGLEMGDMDEEEAESSQSGPSQTLRRQKSSIVIRRDPSAALSSGLHTRTNSQASFYTASSSVTSSTHSRENSQAVLGATPVSQLHHQFTPDSAIQNTRAQYRGNTTTNIQAYTVILCFGCHSYQDGHVIEFDPLQTSPGALDALEGITDSAKKHARVEMGRLVQATMEKWKIG
ncbi:hypothetical protein BDQ17DRAFT_1321312 [Cyathus striatus]|nr:hypothetical protein BDQ17DRAFT_1321312 [Cyathus striatus]